jgi:hypothetical protein
MAEVTGKYFGRANHSATPFDDKIVIFGGIT